MDIFIALNYSNFRCFLACGTDYDDNSRTKEAIISDKKQKNLIWIGFILGIIGSIMMMIKEMIQPKYPNCNIVRMITSLEAIVFNFMMKYLVMRGLISLIKGCFKSKRIATHNSEDDKYPVNGQKDESSVNKLPKDHEINGTTEFDINEGCDNHDSDKVFKTLQKEADEIYNERLNPEYKTRFTNSELVEKLNSSLNGQADQESDLSDLESSDDEESIEMCYIDSAEYYKTRISEHLYEEVMLSKSQFESFNPVLEENLNSSLTSQVEQRSDLNDYQQIDDEMNNEIYIDYTEYYMAGFCEHPYEEIVISEANLVIINSELEENLNPCLAAQVDQGNGFNDVERIEDKMNNEVIYIDYIEYYTAEINEQPYEEMTIPESNLVIINSELEEKLNPPLKGQINQRSDLNYLENIDGGTNIEESDSDNIRYRVRINQLPSVDTETSENISINSELEEKLNPPLKGQVNQRSDLNYLENIDGGTNIEESDSDNIRCRVRINQLPSVDTETSENISINSELEENLNFPLERQIIQGRHLNDHQHTDDRRTPERRNIDNIRYRVRINQLPSVDIVTPESESIPNNSESEEDINLLEEQIEQRRNLTNSEPPDNEAGIDWDNVDFTDLMGMISEQPSIDVLRPESEPIHINSEFNEMLNSPLTEKINQEKDSTDSELSDDENSIEMRNIDNIKAKVRTDEYSKEYQKIKRKSLKQGPCKRIKTKGNKTKRITGNSCSSYSEEALKRN